MTDRALEPTKDPFAEDFAANPRAEGGELATSNDPFEEDFRGIKLAPATSATGAFARGAARGVAPALFSLPAAGAGAAALSEAGSFFGPLGTAAGGIVGGIGGGFAGGFLGSEAQNWLVHKLPESWQDALGMSDRQQKLDEKYHPYASMIGGMTPYAVTMKPGLAPRAALPPNATTLQRVLSHPGTAAAFGGGIMGGMEAGQEIAHGEAPDWAKIAIATGFGVVFNQPTKIGESLIRTGERPVLRLVGRPAPAEAAPAAVPAPAVPGAPAPPVAAEAIPEAATPPPPVTAADMRRELLERTRTGRPYELPPTVADAADTKVMGPGITEGVFHGSEQMSPEAEEAARQTKRTEQSVIGPEPQQDVRAAAVRMHPDLFTRLDDLQRQQAEFANSDAASAKEHLETINKKLDEIYPQVQAANRRAAEAIGAPVVEPQAPAAAPQPPARSIEQQRDFIRKDVAQQLIKAGRPKEEAEAAGALTAARYETRAATLKGARGNAEELYRSEGAEILGPSARTQQILPPQPPRPVNEARLSLLQFLAHRGGLKRSADLESILDKNPTVSGFGRLFRDEGMTADRAREAASEAGYLAENVERTGQQATVKDLLEAIQKESRGNKVYRQGAERVTQATERFAPEGEAEKRAPESRSEPTDLELLQGEHPVDAEGRVLRLPFEDRWGNPRYNTEDANRALTRLGEIANMDVRKAPWAAVVQAKRDIDEIIAQLYFYNPKAPDEILRGGSEVSEYIFDREHKRITDLHAIPQKFHSQILSSADNPEGIADFAKAGREAVDHLLGSHRKGVLELLRRGEEREPKAAGPQPSTIGETQRSGFYFLAGRKLADAPDTLFSQGGQAVINWLRQEGVKVAEIRHFGLDEQFANKKPVTREEFENVIASRMFDFRRKTSWLNPERSPRDYELGGTRAFTGPRIPGRGIYFERLMAFPKKLKGGEEFAPGSFESPHWQDILKGAWASWRGSVREVPGFGKMVVGEEGQSDFMQGASVGRRPRISEKEYLALKAERGKYEKVRDEARQLAYNASPDFRGAEELREALIYRESSPEEWRAKLREAWDKLQSRSTTTDEFKMRRAQEAIGKLETLHRENERFFEPGARNKYAQTESSFTPESPLDESYVRTMARDLIMHAVKEDADSVAISTSDTTGRIQNNPGAAHFYDAQLKPALQRELRRLTGDGSLTLDKVDLPKAQGAKRERPYTVWAAKLTDEAKQGAAEGFPLFQQTRGGIRLNPQNIPGRDFLGAEGVKPILRLTKEANASTFIHESGHQFLGELLRDAEHELAPEQLKADAQTALKWLGVEKTADIGVRQHEKFARGFEQYLREGTAPSPGLARVFAQFRQWLLAIYQTIKGLGEPINEDIRGVFDRLLAEEPQRTVIAPEVEPPKTIGEIHEGDLKEIPPVEKDATESRVADERARAYEQLPDAIRTELDNEQADFLARHEPTSDLGAEVGEGAVRPGPVQSAGQLEGTVPRGGVSGAQSGAQRAGIGQAPPGGNRISGLTGEAGEGRSERAHLGDLPLAPHGTPELTRTDTFNVGKNGNIRTENITSIEQFGRAIEEAKDRIGGSTGPMTDGEVRDAADAMGFMPDELSIEKLAKAFGGIQDLNKKVLAFRMAIRDQSERLGDLMTRISDTNDDALVAQYGKERERFDMMMSVLSSVTTEWGRAGRAFRNLDDWDKVQNMAEFLKERTGRALWQLKIEAKLGSRLDTPAKVASFLRSAQKRSFGGMLLEYFVNNLISGPATHITYKIGNSITRYMEAIPETLVASAIGGVRASFGREGEYVRPGEALEHIKAMGRSMPKSIQAAVEAVRTGQPTRLPGQEGIPLTPFFGDTSVTIARQLQSDPVAWSEAMGDLWSLMKGMKDGIVSTAELVAGGGHAGAPLIGAHWSPLGQIPDVAFRGVPVLPIGSAIRLPGRLVSAIHSWDVTANYEWRLAGRAYREGAGLGKTGNDLYSHIADRTSNPPTDWMKELHKEAYSGTLMAPGGNFVKNLQQFINTTVNLPLLGATRPLKFIDPFVHIGANVINKAVIERTPLGILSSELRADLMGKNGNIAQDTAMARMLVGTALSVAFGSLAAEGYITGSGPEDREKAATWRLAGYQPHSVRVGDIWYQANRLGPFGMHLGIAADLYDVAHDVTKGDFLTAAAHLQHAVTQNIFDESFMKGPADLIKAVEDPGRYGEGYLKNIASDFLPFSVGMAQMARAADPYTRQARTVTDELKRKTPGMSETLFPRRDIWGEPIRNPEALGMAGVTAIYESKITRDPVNQALLQLGIGVAGPERKIRNQDLTDAQYDDFTRIAGRLAKQRLDVIVNSPDWQRWTPAQRHDVIKIQISATREQARGMMMAKYPTIPRDAVAQARQRRTAEPEPIH